MATRTENLPVDKNWIRSLKDGGRLQFLSTFLPKEKADPLFAQLVNSLPLAQEFITIAGKTYEMPRRTSWHGDPECVYRYSRTTFVPQPWTPELTELRKRLYEISGYAFNSVLANFYRDGADSMGEHADKEPELGPTPENIAVASLSLGASRRFVMSHLSRQQRLCIDLPHGSLLLMEGTMQQFWRHSLPKTQKEVGPRLNLTFRVIRTS